MKTGKKSRWAKVTANRGDMTDKQLSLAEFIVNNLDEQDQRDVKDVLTRLNLARVTFKSGGGEMHLVWTDDEGWDYVAEDSAFADDLG